MPPVLSNSDTEGSEGSDGERPTIALRGSSKSQSREGMKNGSSTARQEASEADDADHAGENGEEEGDEDEEDAEEYVVERILSHQWDSEDKCIKYETKWQGWDKPEDLTWEPEENLEGAIETLEEYFDSIGGKPDPRKMAEKQKAAAASSGGGSKKRGRQSAGGAAGSDVKKPRTSPPKRGRPKRAHGKHLDDPSAWGPGAPGEWAPPEPGKDAWEDLLVTVETIEPDKDGHKWAYVRWAEQDDQGRHRKSKEALHLVYQCAPQKMLNFYEKHLVFSSASK